MKTEIAPLGPGRAVATTFLAAALAGLLAGCSGSGAPVTVPTTGCPQSVQQICAQGDLPAGEFGVHCAPTLVAAEADLSFCASAPSPRVETCGSYQVVVVTNVDFSYLYYYDASGALVAIASNGLVKGMQCVAGPAGFTLPFPCSDGADLPVCAGDAGAGG